MTAIEQGRAHCLIAHTEQQAVGIECVRARLEHYRARETGNADHVAVTSLRLAYLIKLWETKYGQQTAALSAHNQLLRDELDRQRNACNDYQQSVVERLLSGIGPDAEQ